METGFSSKISKNININARKNDFFLLPANWVATEAGMPGAFRQSLRDGKVAHNKAITILPLRLAWNRSGRFKSLQSLFWLY